MGFKFESNFNLDGLLDEITTQIENDPEIFTSQNIGANIQNICPVCECERTFEIIEDGKVKCLECETEMKLELEVDVK